MTTNKRAVRLAGALAITAALGGCSMAQLEEFNADLNDYGLVYEDMGPQEQRLPCARGGNLTAVSRLVENRQYTNVENRGRTPARVQVLVGGEVIRDWSLAPGRQSEAYVHSPNLTVEFETTC